MLPLSKSEEKLIRSLKLRKNRVSNQLFVAEGEKLVLDLQQSGLKPKLMVHTELVQSQWKESRLVSEKEMKQITHLSSPSQVLGVFHMLPMRALAELEGTCVFALHQLQDPGNMGTIIRTLDWFGPIPLILLAGSVDPYNPKTVQASMGSIARLPMYTANEEEFASFLKQKNYQLLAAHMHGIPFREVKKREKICIVIGNEGRGLEQFNLSPDALVSLPPSPRSQAESLNASVAASILAYECAQYMGNRI